MDVRRRAARVEVEIGELVLHGLPPVQRHAIGDAVTRELERLLSGHSVEAAAGKALDRADGGTIRMQPDGAGRTGRAIARAIHRTVLDAVTAGGGGTA